MLARVAFSVLLGLTFLTVIISENSGQIEKGFKWKDLKQNYCYYDEEFDIPTEVIEVDVILIVLSVFEVSEDKMEFGLQVILAKMWTPPQLIVNDKEKMEMLSLPSKVMDCLWKPNLAFYNAKKSNLYQDSEPNIVNLFFKGKISHGGRYRLTLSCNMDFHLYPMDSQYCSVDLILSGAESQFLHLHLIFVRSLVASIVNVYIPSFLIVSLSMVSFWLDVNAVPGRVTLGVTAILTLATSIAQARSALPTLDYMTAMDVWLLGCMVTVFLSLIEFTLAQASTRKVSSLKTQESKMHHVNRNWDYDNTRFFNSGKYKPNLEYTMKPKKPEAQKDNLLDRASRIVFPLAFATFTVLYWAYYLNC